MSNYYKYFRIVVFVICLFVASPVYAAVVNAPIIGNNTITEDTEVILDGLFPASNPDGFPVFQSGIIANPGQAITAAPGVVVSLDMDQYEYTRQTLGIAAWGSMALGGSQASALISLGEVHVSLGGSAATQAISWGASARDGGVLHIGDNSDIYAYYSGTALTSMYGSTITIGNNTTLYGTVSGRLEGAVKAVSSGDMAATVTIGNGAVISNDGFYAENVTGQTGSDHNAVISYTERPTSANTATSLVTIGNDANISAGGSGNSNRGLVAGYEAISVFSEVWVGEIVTGSNTIINTYGSSSNMGAEAIHYGSVITIGAGFDITTRGSFSYGVYSISGGQINLGEGGRILTNDNGSHGLHAFGIDLVGATAGIDSVVQTSNGVRVETLGRASHGAYASAAESEYGAQVLLGEGNIIITRSDDARGVAANGAGALVSAGNLLEINTFGDANAAGVWANSGGQVNIGANARITTGGSDSYGLSAQNAGSYIGLGAGSVIETSGSGAHAVYALNGSTVQLNGARMSAAAADASAIWADTGSQVTGGGLFDITGDMYAGTGALVDITMEDGSRFAGGTQYLSNDASSRLDLTLNGAATEWDVFSGYSDLTNLYMNGARVDMTFAALGSEVFVLNLGRSADDNGVFRMNTDIVDQFADHLYVGGTAQGTYRIDVVNDGSQATAGTELTDLIYVEEGQPVVFILDHIVELGGFQYDLRQPDRDTGTTFLTPRADHFDNAWYLGGNGRASVAGSGAINSFAGSYLMAYADTQTLIQRMGDLRQSPYGQGLWFRVHGGKFESNSKSYVRGFEMDYGGVQIGYDRKIENKWDGTLYAGIMFGYSKGDLDYRREGSSEVDSKTLGVYGTYIARNGWYVDTILKYQWMTNDFDVIDTAGTLVRGQDVDTGGIGASLEIGKRVHLGDGKENRQGWYVEPQLQLSYQRQDGGFFNATNGLRIGVDSFTSLLGRVGMLVGYETDRTNFYAKISRVKEFDGDLAIDANGIRIPESFEDDWWVYGIGFTSRVNDRNSLYLDIERTSGGSFSQPWRIFAGWRVEF